MVGERVFSKIELYPFWTHGRGVVLQVLEAVNETHMGDLFSPGSGRSIAGASLQPFLSLPEQSWRRQLMKISQKLKAWNTGPSQETAVLGRPLAHKGLWWGVVRLSILSY